MSDVRRSGVSLTQNQARLLRAIERAEGHEREGYRTLDGNEDRTARSLVKKGLAAWHPPGTRVGLWPTNEGRSAIRPGNRCTCPVGPYRDTYCPEHGAAHA